MQVSLFEPFITRLERLGLPYFVTGSAAGIAYGEPRMTHDIDIVVALMLRDVPAFVAADIYIAHDELHRWALANRRRLTMG